MYESPENKKPKNPTFKAFKRLFSLALTQWKTLLIGMCFLFIGSATGLAFPQGIRFIIDGAMENGIQMIDNAAFFMLAIFFVQGIAIAFRYHLFVVAGFRIVTDLRSNIYQHIIQQEIGFFDQRNTGELLSRISSDTTVLQNAASVNISMGLRSLTMTLGGIGLLLYTSPTLTLLMLLIVPPMVLGALLFGRKVRKLSKEAQDALAHAGEVAAETISAVRTVRAFTRESHEVGRFRKAVLKTLEATRKRSKAGAMFQGILSFVGFGAIAGVLWYGGRLVAAGMMSLGDLTSFILYTLLVASALGNLGTLFTDFMNAIGAADRIFELLDRTPKVPVSGGRQLDSVQGAVTFENVDFTYPTRPEIAALSHVSLNFRAGEITALVGPSGGGKSTMAALIPRFYDVNKGRILIDGHPIMELDPFWLRQQLGTVPQETSLFSTSIAENIGYGRQGSSLDEIRAAAKIANAHDFIEALPQGYDTQVGERGIRLSGGQKQRVAIARAILRNPAILILDEATSALDTENEFLVKDALSRLMQGRTTIIIAHRLSTVKDAQQVVVVNQGRVQEIGSHEELMQNSGGFYRKLVEWQFSGSDSS